MSTAVRGDWAGLDWQAERYQAIARLLTGCTSVLDVGAGEGLLSAYLPYACEYEGVEPEAAAINRARERRPDMRLHWSLVEHFTPHRQFAGIVFNESLYYLTDPVAAVTRAAQWLEPDGLLVCSVYQRPARSWSDKILGTPNARAERQVRKLPWPVVADETVTIGDHVYHVWAVTAG